MEKVFFRVVFQLVKYAQRIFRNFRQISELTGFFDEKFLQSMRKGEKMALTGRAGRAGKGKIFTVKA